MSKEKIKEAANSFSTFEQMYDDVITKGVDSIDFMLDNQDNKWKRIELFWMLGYFAKKEEYEKCVIIRDLLVNHFIAEGDKEKELNDRMDKLLNQNKDE
jgi:hypothetical protein